MAARVVAAALLLCLRGWAQIPESTRTLVDYDRSLALHLKQAEKEGTAQARVFEIEYDSPRGGRVPGYLVAPRSSGRFAGIVFGTGARERPRNFWRKRYAMRVPAPCAS